jgi:hypothetical protein
LLSGRASASGRDGAVVRPAVGAVVAAICALMVAAGWSASLGGGRLLDGRG